MSVSMSSTLAAPLSLNSTLPRSAARMADARTTPEQIRASLSDARFKDFHKNRRILVVDDHPPTLYRLQKSLGQLYAQVDVASSAKEAEQLIKSASVPYDAVVLDLYMPGKNGVQFMREMQGRLPAVVINTASMMAPVVADLSGQISNYQSGCAAELMQKIDFVASQSALPVAPVLMQHKFGSLADLVDKIDFAMLVNQQRPESLKEFVAAFNPALVPTSVPAEIVHRFCEWTNSAAREIAACQRNLLEKHKLAETSWWKTNSTNIESSLSKLLAVDYTNTHLETAELTSNRLHEIIFHMYGLAAPCEQDFSQQDKRLIALLADKDDFKEEIRLWERTQTLAVSILNGLRQSLIDHNRSTFDFDAFFQQLQGCSHSYVSYYDPQDKGRFPLKDPEHFIRNLLVKLNQLFRARWDGLSYQEAGPGVCASFVREDAMSSFFKKPFYRKLAQINCGSYYSIAFSDDIKKSLEVDLADVLPTLGELVNHKLGVWSFHEGGRNFFEIYLKATDKTRDFAAEEVEAARKKADGTFILPDNGHKVFEDLGEKKSLVAVRDRPLDVKIGSAMLYRWQDKVIFASGGQHIDAAANIAHYIAYTLSQRNEDTSHWTGIAAFNRVYQEGARLFCYEGMFTMEGCWSDESYGWIPAVLKEFGIAEENLRWGDSGDFADRPDLR